jgi:hypothetical protein
MPSVAVLLTLPVGSLVLEILGHLGWFGAPFALQGLMLFSVVGGVVEGCLVLSSVEEAKLSPTLTRRAKLLAGLAVPGPFLTLLIGFLIADQWVIR